MKARYHDVRLSGSVLECSIENDSGAAWHETDGLVFGSQAFDPESGVVLLEGERIPLPREVGPRDRVPVRLALSLPPEPGSYEVRACLLRLNEAWSYDLGFPYIVCSAEVSGSGSAELGHPRVTDRAAIRRIRFWMRIARAFVFPFRTVFRNWHLSQTLVKREILARSRGSFAGSLWTFLNPLLLMLTYFFVFGLFLKQRFGNDSSPVAFALYLLAGMLPWIAISEAVGRAPLVLIENRTLLRKLVFPIETLPVNLVFTGLVGECFGVAVFTVCLLVARGRLPWTIVYLPLVLIPQMMFTAGLCWFLAALGPFLRDIGQFIGFGLTIWFFLTPICYPETQVPAEFRSILTKNPVFVLVRAYRAIFLEGHAPDWRSMLILTAASFLLAVAGHAWFYKLRKSFVDML